MRNPYFSYIFEMFILKKKYLMDRLCVPAKRWIAKRIPREYLRILGEKCILHAVFSMVGVGGGGVQKQINVP